MIEITNINFKTYNKLLECQNFLYNYISKSSCKNNYSSYSSYGSYSNYSYLGQSNINHLNQYGFTIDIDHNNFGVITLLENDPELRLLIELKYSN